MNDCEPCLLDRHEDCDTTAWTDLGRPTVCSCFTLNHPGWDHDFQPTPEQEEANRRD